VSFQRPKLKNDILITLLRRVQSEKGENLLLGGAGFEHFLQVLFQSESPLLQDLGLRVPNALRGENRRLVVFSQLKSNGYKFKFQNAAANFKHNTASELAASAGENLYWG
jgi:hypothetical protein